jgi:hypothetical protein
MPLTITVKDPLARQGGNMIKLTEKQKNLLIFIGSPDDGSQVHIRSMDDLHVQWELVKLGLVHKTNNIDGKPVYDLTDEGERIYGKLTGEDLG